MTGRPLGFFDQPTTAFVVSRGAHFCACLLLLATFVFDQLVLPSIGSEARRWVEARWKRMSRLIALICIPLAFVSGAAWFGLVAADMGGTSLGQTLDPDVLRQVWADTQFGRVWQIRGVLWLIASVALLALTLLHPRVLRLLASTIGLLASAALCGTLAWAGHGSTGPFPAWHLSADVIHLIISGVWPAGLLPFAWLLLTLRQASDEVPPHAIAALTRRFSALSLVSVLLLAATGLINTLALLGPISNLLTTGYGKLLLAKIVLFVLMAGLGAINLLRYKPRLVATPDRHTARLLQTNVGIEIILGVVVILIVSMLGLLPPGVG